MELIPFSFPIGSGGARVCAAVFWFSLSTLAYTFAGYPLLMRFLGNWRSKRAEPLPPRPCPPVTVVLVVHNEATRITDRLHNLLAADYPAERLQVIVVSDGSTDQTGERVRGFSDPRVVLLPREHCAGKAECLNAALPLAQGEIVVFADARQRFAPETIRRLVEMFAAPGIGAVSGALVINPAMSGPGRGMDLYWRLEKFLRQGEAGWDSSIGCTGAVYAIRRRLFQPIPSDTILDDVVIPMRIALQGYRVAFAPAAVAYDPQPLEPKTERNRKTRTLAGNFQMLFRYPSWLLPWRNRLWGQLASHKYLRLLAPGLLVLTLVSNALLAAAPWYGLVFGMQCLALGFAAVGLLLGIAHPVFRIPATFWFLNWIILEAFWAFLTKRYAAGWSAKVPTATAPETKLLLSPKIPAGRDGV